MAEQLAKPAEACTVLAFAFESDPTYRARAERTSPVELMREQRYLEALPHVQQMMNAVSSPVLVLNRTMQIVFCNHKSLEFAGATDACKLMGLRLGEAMGCVKVNKATGGCGTCEFCKICGALHAILTAVKGKANAQECHLMRRRAGVVESMELSVHATPLEMAIPGLILLSLDDISHEKRRRNLERIFFHDILNAMNGVVGYSFLIKEDAPEQLSPLVDKLEAAIGQVLSEIHLQREMLAAENHELEVCRSLITTLDFLRDLASLYSAQEIAFERNIVVSPDSENIAMEIDPAILGRVIGNMVKNALEASQPGEKVTLSCKMVGEKVRFGVHNPAFMPREVQLQLFSRSFSTKGSGRGLGTYGMKLLSERYLQGSVSFESDRDSGTTFYAQYPPRLPERD
jgi:nitrogen-specific signal transduction histidine kinase